MNVPDFYDLPRPASHTLHEDVAADDRPREKAKRLGFTALSQAELIAVLIGTGSRGEHVVELCKRILDDHDQRFGHLARREWIDLLRAYKGIGEVKALQIQAALEIARRYHLEDFDNDHQICSSAEAYAYLRPRMEHLTHEELWVLLLNRGKRVITHERISAGGTAMTVADIKMILKPAVNHLAHGIILAHNHPGGTPYPSSADVETTHRVVDALGIVGIRALDHVIISGGAAYSMASGGLIENGRLSSGTLRAGSAVSAARPVPGLGWEADRP